MHSPTIEKIEKKKNKKEKKNLKRLKVRHYLREWRCLGFKRAFDNYGGELNKQNRVLHGLSNQQMGNKLHRGGLNLGPLAKLGSDTMLNDQFS